MGSRLHVLEGWSSWLIGFGIAQMLLSIAMLAAALLTVFNCQSFFHVSYGVFAAPVLFLGALVTVSGFKCTPRMLTGLGVVSILFLLVALAAAFSGGLGYYCEAESTDNYAMELCKSANGVFGEQCVVATWPDDVDTFENDRMMGKVANAVVLGSAALYALLAFVIACIAFCAESRLEGAVVAPFMPYAPVASVHSAAAPPGAPTVPFAAATVAVPTGGEAINISNVNTANVSTQVASGAESTPDDGMQSARSPSRSSPSTQSTGSSSRPSSRSSSRRSPRN